MKNTTAAPIKVWFQSDKNGNTAAYRWSMMQFRSFRISNDKAREMLLDGTATLIPCNPFPKGGAR